MNTKDEDERDARARARSTWPVRRYRLGAEPDDDLTLSTSAEERLAMMWPLAITSFALAGRPIPAYPRAAAPGRVARPGDPREQE